MGTPNAESTAQTEVADRLASFRHLREEIERSILPLATSVDGVSFELQASLYHLSLRRGCYVMLEGAETTRLGQITDLRTDTVVAAAEGLAGGGSSVLIRLARGIGVVLDTDGSTFHDATVRPADPTEVGSWSERVRPKRAGLAVGEFALAPGVPVVLDSGGLDRHTFLCGQSGSGKTYSLGVLLERVLTETDMRVIILDPNSDYVGLSRIRAGADPESASRYAQAAGEVGVWRSSATADHLLRLRFADLEPAVQGAVLRIDPIEDRDEYALLSDLLRGQAAGSSPIRHADQLLEADDPDIRRLGVRAANLGVLDWSLWGPDLPSLVDEVRNPTSRCTVVDLGSLDTMEEQRVAAGAVLSTLWESRASRQPCLIVIDEAHNVCAAEPADRVSGLAAQRAVQIAAEGRKYGLHLLVATQRPHKVHEDVLSQCDNLLLMRMNSQADLDDLVRVLSFVPRGLMAGATSFQLGEALVAGKLLPQAAYVRMGARVSEEGGADIPSGR